MADNTIKRITGIIPARYGSTRFPGKPLAKLGGKFLIQHVYEKSVMALEETWVATDDSRIYDAVISFGGKAVMTLSSHQSGTDRCAEAAIKIEKSTGKNIDVVINIQGDEPFIKPEQISRLASVFNDPEVEIATLIREVRQGEDISDPNHPKVITDLKGNAIYFSRSVIPFLRDVKDKDEWILQHRYFKHIGIYGYRKDILLLITGLKPSPLEKAESLEQNRWIENGYRIRTSVTEWKSISIDTPDDLTAAVKYLNMNR